MSNRSVVDRVRGAGMRALAAGMALSSAGLAGTPPTLRGDLNCDGFITIADISPFVQLLLDPAGYAIAFPDCDPASGDTNQDGFVTVGDIGSFVAMLTEPAGPLFPNPLYFGDETQLHDINGDGILDAIFGASDPSTSTTSIGVRYGTVNGEFLNPQYSPMPGGVWRFAVADFDGDGSLDVAAAEGFGGAVYVSLGNGNGLFEPATLYFVNSGSFDIAAGDLDGDGGVDLAVTSSWTSEVAVFQGVGDGSFEPPQHVAVGFSTFALATADVDLDGDLDIVADGDASLLLQNQGGWTFQVRPTGLLGSGESRFAIGDIDLDGLPDIVSIVNYGSVQVGLGDGTGNFSATGNPLFTQDNAYDIELGDTDGDGDLDILVPIVDYYDLITFRNLGGGQFESGSWTHGLENCLQMTTGDIEGDGDLDVMLFGFGICPLLNRGDGSFDTRQVVSLPDYYAVIALADLDQDGDLDVLAEDWGSQQSTIALLGDGDGNFGLPLPVGPPNPYAIYPLIVDATGDSIPDLIRIGDRAIVVLPGAGDGTFGAQILSPANLQPGEPYLSDFNQDGRVDLLSQRQDLGLCAVFFGNGAGNFVEGPSTPWSGARLAVGDFNEDGIPDGTLLRLVSPSQSELQIRLGVGDGTFGVPNTLPLPTGLSFEATIRVADSNHDGHLDLLIQNFVGGVLVFLGAGDGSFGSPITSPDAIAGPAVDIDSDGNLDLLVVQLGRFGFCFGDGTGSFQAPTYFAMSYLDNPEAAALGDIDADGDLDLVAPEVYQYGLQVIKNRRYR